MNTYLLAYLGIGALLGGAYLLVARSEGGIEVPDVAVAVFGGLTWLPALCSAAVGVLVVAGLYVDDRLRSV